MLGVTLPADAETARDRRARAITAYDLAGKFVGVASRLISVPLALRLLGQERYGLWQAVVALVAWLNMAPLGLGQGLVNHVAAASGRQDRQTLREYVSSAFTLVCALSIGLLVLVALAAWRETGVGRLLGIHSGSPLEVDARIVLLILGSAVSVGLTANLGAQVAYALQEGHLGSMLGIVQSGLALAGLAIAWLLGVSLPVFVALMVTPGLIASAGFTAYFLFRRHPELRPRVAAFSFQRLRSAYASGSVLFLSQLTELAILYAPTVLVANRLGPAEVPRITVTYSLFIAAANFINPVLTPLWPAYAEASANQDADWIRRTFTRSIRATVPLMVLFSLAMLVAGRPFINYWAGSVAVPSMALLGTVCIYYVVAFWNACIHTLVRGLGLFGWYKVSLPVVAACCIGGVWVLLPKIGLVAVPAMGLLAVTIDSVAFSIVFRDMWLRGRQSIEERP